MVDRVGPTYGDTDELGGVWMSLPTPAAAEPHAFGSAADTDALFDGTHTRSLPLAAPLVRLHSFILCPA